MMNKEQKKNYIKEMTDFFQKNESVLVTHYKGLNVNNWTTLENK